MNGVGKACFVLLAWNSLRVDWWSERYGHFIYLAFAGLVVEWVFLKLATVYICRGSRQSSVHVVDIISIVMNIHGALYSYPWCVKEPSKYIPPIYESVGYIQCRRL